MSLEALDLKTPKRSITIDAGKKEILSIGIQGPPPDSSMPGSVPKGMSLIPSKIEAAASGLKKSSGTKD